MNHILKNVQVFQLNIRLKKEILINYLTVFNKIYIEFESKRGTLIIFQYQSDQIPIGIERLMVSSGTLNRQCDYYIITHHWL